MFLILLLILLLLIAFFTNIQWTEYFEIKIKSKSPV